MSDENSASLSTSPPVEVVDDGWTVRSGSTNAPTQENLLEELKTIAEPVTAAPDATPEETPAETPEETLEASDDDEPKKSKRERNTYKERTAAMSAEIKALDRSRKEMAAQALEEKTALEKIRAERTAAARPVAPPEVPTELGLRPVWKTFEDDGKTWDEYDTAREAYDAKRFELFTVQAEQKAERKANAIIAEERRHARDQANRQRFEQSLDDVRKAEPGFDAMVEKNLSDVPVGYFMTAVIQQHPQGAQIFRHCARHPDDAKVLASLTPPMEVFDTVKESEHPDLLLAYIAQHQAEYQEIMSRPPAQAQRALGRLDGSLARGATVDPGSPPASTPVSKAKPPIQPVGGASRAVASADSDDTPLSLDYISRENQADRSRRRRV